MWGQRKIDWERVNSQELLNELVVSVRCAMCVAIELVRLDWIGYAIVCVWFLHIIRIKWEFHIPNQLEKTPKSQAQTYTASYTFWNGLSLESTVLTATDKWAHSFTTERRKSLIEFIHCHGNDSIKLSFYQHMSKILISTIKFRIRRSFS